MITTNRLTGIPHFVSRTGKHAGQTRPVHFTVRHQDSMNSRNLKVGSRGGTRTRDGLVMSQVIYL